MKKHILLVLALVLCLGISTTSPQTTQDLAQRPVLQKPKAILDLATIRKQKIKVATLPDSQQVLIAPGVIKTMRQMRQEWRAAKMANEAKAKAVSARKLGDFEHYRQSFLSKRAQVKRDLEIRKAALIAKLKSVSPPPGNNAAQLSEAGKAALETPPVVTAIDPNSGMFGAAVLITGTNFGNTQGLVSFMASATRWLDGGIAYWSDTQIIATVPDNTGYPDYNGFLVVHKPLGKKSNPINFQITSEQDLMLLAGTGASAKLNVNPHDGALPGCIISGYVHSFVGSMSDIMVYHDPTQDNAGFDCAGADYLWQNLVLKNGWVVDKVVLTPVAVANLSYVKLMNNPVGTTIPLVQVDWGIEMEVNSDTVPFYYVLTYEVQVYIRGPEGVPYQ